MPVGGRHARSVTLKKGDYGGRLKFDEEFSEDGISFGALSIPDKSLPLYIVDMQHRHVGDEWAMQEADAELRKFPLAVTIADGLSKMEEVDQFDLINTTQKKVRTDLARRLKSIQVQDQDHLLALDQRGKLWQAKGPMIAQKLNTQTVLGEAAIPPPNKSKADQPTIIVRETSFVTSLKPALQTPYFIRKSDDTAAELINRYWMAIQKVWPKGFNNPVDYAIQSRQGVFSLHELAPKIFEMVRDKGDITVQNLYEGG